MPADGSAGTAADAARLLAAAPMLAGLPPRLLQLLAERAAPRVLARGEVLFLRGDPGTAMYLVGSGRLKVYDSSPSGTELVIATVGPGATVGELALADGGPRSASVSALEPSRVLVVGRDEFLHAVRTEGALAEPLLRYLAAQVRRLTDLAGDLVFLDLHARVAKLLLRLAGDAGPGSVVGPLTQSELAAMVGASRQSTNAVLRAFASAGWLALDGRTVRLLRPDLLRERSGPSEVSGS